MLERAHRLPISLNDMPRDFMDEVQDALAVQDPHFELRDSCMWQEHAVEPKVDKTALLAADKQLACLNEDARRRAWEHDQLLLARDVAAISRMMESVEKSIRSQRTQRIMHLRSENTIGASIVSNYLKGHGVHKSGTDEQLSIYLDQDWGILDSSILSMFWASPHTLQGFKKIDIPVGD